MEYTLIKRLAMLLYLTVIKYIQNRASRRQFSNSLLDFRYGSELKFKLFFLAANGQ